MDGLLTPTPPKTVREQHSELAAVIGSTRSLDLEGRECIFDIMQIVGAKASQILREEAQREPAPSCLPPTDDRVSRIGTGTVQSEDSDEICCMKLDHMRDEQRYVKTLRQWSRDLGLHGRYLPASLRAPL